MQLDERFDDLVASLAGFHNTWLVYLGVELGLFTHLRAAGAAGLTTVELAEATGCRPEAIEAWAWAADAHELATLEGDRLTVDEDIAIVLLDEQAPRIPWRPVRPLGRGVARLGRDASTSSGPARRSRDRPDRYRVAIERLTVQDIAVFFQEALAELPQLVADLPRGGRVVDIHCGGGRWLIAMARRFPALELVGVEFEPDSVAARARERRGGRPGRPDHDPPGRCHRARRQAASTTSPTSSTRSTSSPTRSRRCGRRGRRSDPGGRLLVLDWPLPSNPDEFRTRHGELIAGVQLDELYQGTALATREQFARLVRGGRAARRRCSSTCRRAPRCSCAERPDRELSAGSMAPRSADGDRSRSCRSGSRSGMGTCPRP